MLGTIPVRSASLVLSSHTSLSRPGTTRGSPRNGRIVQVGRCFPELLPFPYAWTKLKATEDASARYRAKNFREKVRELQEELEEAKSAMEV